MTTAAGIEVQKWISYLGPVAVVLALVVAVVWVGPERLVEGTTEIGVVPFFAAMAVLPAVGVPTTPLYLLAGAAFGVPIALLGTAVSTTLNLALTCWLGRSYLRPILQRVLRRLHHPLPDLGRLGAWRFAILVKITPGVFAFLKNYLVGVAGVPMGIYFASLWPLTMLRAAAVILLGEGLYGGDYIMIAGGAAALLALIGALEWLRRRWRQHSARDDQETPGPADAEAPPRDADARLTTPPTQNNA